MRDKLSKDDIENIKKLREQGYSLGELAIKYGVTRQCIQQRLSYKKCRDKKRISYKEEALKLQDIIRNKEKRIHELESEVRRLKHE